VREEVIAEIRRNTVITKSKIENLLVNPETQAVKNDSSEISVFSICAKITEEGLYIKSMKDDEGNLTRVAEFE
jgi:hypothetical protein